MKKMFRKFWAFENKDAVTLNHKEIEAFTRAFIQKVNNIQLAAKGAKIKIKNSPDFIIGNNRKIIKKINKVFLINFITEIQKHTILNYYKINEKDIINFYCCIIDLFAKPFF